MFTTLLLSICCFSLVLTSTVDRISSEDHVHGKQYTIKSTGVTYTQHISNHGQCAVELNNPIEKSDQLTEGEIIQIKGKWYKVEDCRLNRAYVASCGSKLFRQMRDVVCSYVENHHHGKKITKRRQPADDLIEVIDRSYYGNCCKSACTISELARYCFPQW